MGIATVIITLGHEGALVLDRGTFTHVPSRKVRAVDTTAAGDIFNGALCVALAEGKDVVSATQFACHAAALSVTRMGAQASAPYRYELSETP
jgi:ribokinase